MKISSNEKNLSDFIDLHKQIFKSLQIPNEWNEIIWNVRNWIKDRNPCNNIIFSVYKSGVLRMSEEFEDFTKAFSIYIQRKKSIGYGATRNYVRCLRILYNIMKDRNEISPSQLTRWHFDETIFILSKQHKTNLYNISACLGAIANILDDLQITPSPILFINKEKPQKHYYDYKQLSEISSGNTRINNDKLPSYEAMVAYAKCTNNPINDNEAIILRTIDLLIATGQRINEITCIPFNCLVETPEKDNNGNIVLNSSGKAILNVGIRYYPEKNMSPRVHWLADQDIPLVIRAIADLKKLTEPIREIAKFQEKYKRLWKFDSEYIISDSELLEYLCVGNINNLHSFLSFRKIKPSHKCVIDEMTENKQKIKKFYKAGDIENLFISKINNHIVLNEGKKIILKTSDILSITFDYRHTKSRVNMIKILPRKLHYREIADALGTGPRMSSIFTVRGLTETDGSRIKIKTHQPRHWRNTLYELAGMSNVNQALAMGRQLLDQNVAYHHPTLEEHTQTHRDFLNFNSVAEKVEFLKTGIRSKNILGELTETYHNIKLKKGDNIAELFLKTFANAMHITPYGVCTNDFSLQPCPLHLECWNGCSNLHMTGSDHETEQLQGLIAQTEDNLIRMQKEESIEFGVNRFTNRLEKQLNNMKKALELAKKSKNIRLFPEGIDLSSGNRKIDIISGE